MTEKWRNAALQVIQGSREAGSTSSETMQLQRLREMSCAIPGSSRKLVMCEYRDRPQGDCGYAEGKVELSDGTRHDCCGCVIKGALNGFCVITIITPDDDTPIEVSALFTLGYAVGITYMQWPDGLLIQVSLEDSVLVTTGHDRFIYASFPSAEPSLPRPLPDAASPPNPNPKAFKRPSDHEFVVFLEPPVNPVFPGMNLGMGKAIDISHSCQVAQALKTYVVAEVEAGNGRMDKGILIVPEESPLWIEIARKLGAKQERDVRENARSQSKIQEEPIPIKVASGADHRHLPVGGEDFDFALWCLLLQGQESWQPQKRRDETKVEVGLAGTMNEKREGWTLFDYKLSDPSQMIVKAIGRSRSATGFYEPSGVGEDDLYSPEATSRSPVGGGGAAEARAVQFAAAAKAEAAFNLRCMPLFLRAVYTWQDKQALSENITLKGSGYRILIKAARSIKERSEKAVTPKDKKAAERYRSETLPVLLRLLPHVLHQVQDENWSTFTMGLEFAWWLSEIAPVSLNLSGLHVLSCARVLGCR
jgi:hypothetical protein